ncbi:MAG: recombinase family protein [Anaeroplasmataceae bacterium]|nr:recombinase family protein [Anaeroplasmataceae bacterium]
MIREGEKCVIYIRVSTEMQVDGFSLDGQRNTLKRYADRERLIVENIYEDAENLENLLKVDPPFLKC